MSCVSWKSASLLCNLSKAVPAIDRDSVVLFFFSFFFLSLRAFRQRDSNIRTEGIILAFWIWCPFEAFARTDTQAEAS